MVGGELLAIVEQNCPASVRDAPITDKLMVFTSCLGRNLAVMSCECPSPEPPTVEKQVRYSVLILSIFTELVTMNAPDSVPVSLRFIMRTR